MPWKGWDSPRDPYSNPTKGGWLFSRNSKNVSDAAIDKLLKGGKNPRSVLRRAMQNMSPQDRAVVQRRIKARETKRSQGKEKK